MAEKAKSSSAAVQYGIIKGLRDLCMRGIGAVSFTFLVRQFKVIHN